MHLENTIIYLIGFAGAGKYTIAKELVKRTEAKLVDNHLINNPIFNVIEKNGKTPLPFAVWDAIGVIRSEVLKTIETLSPAYFSFIFTNVLYESLPSDHKGFDRIKQLAAVRRSRFLPIRLICNEKALELRKNTPERAQRFKEIDISNIQQLLKEHEVLKVKHPNLLTLDVSELSAHQSADVILEHVRARYAD